MRWVWQYEVGFHNTTLGLCSIPLILHILSSSIILSCIVSLLKCEVALFPFCTLPGAGIDGKLRADWQQKIKRKVNTLHTLHVDMSMFNESWRGPLRDTMKTYLQATQSQSPPFSMFTQPSLNFCHSPTMSHPAMAYSCHSFILSKSKSAHSKSSSWPSWH